MASGPSAIRARIEWVRGMCSDEAPHVDIDVALGEILDIIDGHRWEAPEVTDVA